MAPVARTNVPPEMAEVADALTEAAVTGVAEVSRSLDPAPTASVGLPSLRLLIVTLANVFVVAPAKVTVLRPLIVRALVAAIAPPALTLIVAPPPWTPPLTTSPPAGTTMSPAFVGDRLTVPRLKTVPSE